MGGHCSKCDGTYEKQERKALLGIAITYVVAVCAGTALRSNPGLMTPEICWVVAGVVLFGTATFVSVLEVNGARQMLAIGLLIWGPFAMVYLPVTWDCLACLGAAGAAYWHLQPLPSVPPSHPVDTDEKPAEIPWSPPQTSDPQACGSP